MPSPDELVHDGQIEHDGSYYHDGETFHRWREYIYEFDVPPMRYRNASAVRRPDAISPDYLTSFTVGPVAVADVSRGMVDRLWKVRLVGHTIMIARTNAGFHA